jgi:hypothetical protein
MTHLSQHNGRVATDPADIERDIARQREELARTVDALSHKLDVKHRAQDALHDRTSRLVDATTTADGKPRPDLLAIGAAVAAGVAMLVWWRKHS